VLFVGMILISLGYTLVYAGVAGDNYTVGNVPVWRAPWLPFVDIFTGHALSGGAGPTNSGQPASKAMLDSLITVINSGTATTTTPAGGPGPTGTFAI
jgi:hypothetical protein